MPCVILLLECQHSRLFEAAHDLARAAAAGAMTWPRDLDAFRRDLWRHDRTERDVLQRLGAKAPSGGLGCAFDLALASQPGLDREAVAAAARHIAGVIAEHADAQEDAVFPDLVERHEEPVRKRIGERYQRMSLSDAEMDEAAALA